MPRAAALRATASVLRWIDEPRLAEMQAAAKARDDVFASEWLELRLVYDTGRPGRSNSGHTFGDELERHARDALIEYRNTLQD